MDISEESILSARDRKMIAEDDRNSQIGFLEIIKAHRKYLKYHGRFDSEARIGASFLRRLEASSNASGVLVRG